MIDLIAVLALSLLIPSCALTILLTIIHIYSTILTNVTTYITHQQYPKWQAYNQNIYPKNIHPLMITAAITCIIHLIGTNTYNVFSVAILILSIIYLATEISKKFPKIKPRMNYIQRIIYYTTIVPIGTILPILMIIGIFIHQTHMHKQHEIAYLASTYAHHLNIQKI